MDEVNSGTNASMKSLMNRYSDEGLYLIFEDGEEVNLSRKAVEELRHKLEKDESLISLVKRTDADFKTCSICPARGSAAMCHALPAIIPFVQSMKSRASFDKVVAVYVDDCKSEVSGNVLHAGTTSLARAMQYVAIESVLWHCETGRMFFKYFTGIVPFSSAEDIAERIYANVMLDLNGDAEQVDARLNDLCEKLMIAMQCQVRRVALVAESDVFSNAFVNLYMALNMLEPDMRDKVRGRIAKRERADA